jgi:hypothetical protein
MTKERTAQSITILVIAGALVFLAVKRGGFRSQAAASDPQDTIYRMLDAARDGDIRAYLRCYTGQMESSLRHIASEKGNAAFAAYLKDFNAPIKGVALTPPQPAGDGEVRMRVEFVYQNRNESQLFYLRRGSEGWQIARLESAQGVKLAVPYGTPVE